MTDVEEGQQRWPSFCNDLFTVSNFMSKSVMHVSIYNKANSNIFFLMQWWLMMVSTSLIWLQRLMQLLTTSAKWNGGMWSSPLPLGGRLTQRQVTTYSGPNPSLMETRLIPHCLYVHGIEVFLSCGLCCSVSSTLALLCMIRACANLCTDCCSTRTSHNSALDCNCFPSLLGCCFSSLIRNWL